jgi:rhodanese-related sulfurtransferase
LREVTVDQLAAASDQEIAVVIDVREPAEYREGHVPAARNVPMSQFTNRLNEIERDRPVYVVCASGNRSAVVADFLTRSGIEAINVTGGTTAWIRSGRPTEL